MFSIRTSDKHEEVNERVKIIIDHCTFCMYNYTARGLFERDKLIFSAQMSFAILALRGEIPANEL